MCETSDSKDFNLTPEEIDQLRDVIFLLDNEPSGDNWEDESDLLKKIISFAEQDKVIG